MYNNIKEKLSQFEKEVLNTVSLLTKQVSTLEKENQELKDRLRDRDFSDKNYQAYLKLETEYQCLLANNNELKEIESRTLKHNSVLVGRLRKQQDKFIKVVESVLNNHIHMNYKCSCGWESETDTFGDHLLQEIKSAIEKDK